MKENVRSILNLKTNVFVTLAITAVSSLTTLLLAVNLGFIVPDSSLSQAPLAAVATRVDPDITNCDAGVYSPVQNKCVSQDVFDAEMQRLLAALGLDGSLYQQQSSINQ